MKLSAAAFATQARSPGFLDDTDKNAVAKHGSFSKKLRKCVVLLSEHFKFLNSEAFIKDSKSAEEGTSYSTKKLKRCSAGLNRTTVAREPKPFNATILGYLIQIVPPI